MDVTEPTIPREGTNPPSENKRSIFVTIIAWLLIIYTGFMALVSFAQVFMIHVAFKDEFEKAMVSAVDQSNSMPGMYSVMFSYFGELVLLFSLLSVVSFAGSVGLLLRKNWGRIITIGVLCLAVGLTGFSVYSQHAAQEWMLAQQDQIIFEYADEYDEPNAKEDNEECCESDPCCNKNKSDNNEMKKERAEEMRKEMRDSFNSFIWVSYIMALIFSLIEIFIIWKLTRPHIVAEFK